MAWIVLGPYFYAQMDVLRNHKPICDPGLGHVGQVAVLQLIFQISHKTLLINTQLIFSFAIDKCGIYLLIEHCHDESVDRAPKEDLSLGGTMCMAVIYSLRSHLQC